MPFVTHIFESHKRIENGRVVSHDFVPRRANFEYDIIGRNVVISIIPTLTPKRARLVREDGFTLYYVGEDPVYRFIIECWPDNGTIKRFSLFRDDKNLEIQYLSSHQDRL